MKTLEKVLLAVIMLALAMKVAHLPLSGFFFIIGITILSILYFLLAWLLFPAPTKKDQIIALSVLGGFVLSLALMGILFKIQLWPLAHSYLTIALPGIVIFIVAVFVVRGSKPELASYTKALLLRAFPLLIFCFVLYLIPNKALINYYYKDDPAQAEIMIKLDDGSIGQDERDQLIMTLDSMRQVQRME